MTLTPDDARRLLPELTAAFLAGDDPRPTLRSAGASQMHYLWGLADLECEAICRDPSVPWPCDRHLFDVAVRECQRVL